MKLLEGMTGKTFGVTHNDSSCTGPEGQAYALAKHVKLAGTQTMRSCKTRSCGPECV
jgi:hypothetical protein